MSVFFLRSPDGLVAYQPDAGAVVDSLDSIRVETPDKEKLKAMPKPALTELAVKFGLRPTPNQTREVIASDIVERFEGVRARLNRTTAPASSSQDVVNDHTMDSITGKQVPTSGHRSLVDVVKKEQGFHVGFYEGNTEQFHIYTPFGMYQPEKDMLTFLSRNNCVFLSATEGRDEGWWVSSDEGSEDDEQSEVEQSEIATTSPEDVAPTLEEVADETEVDDEPLVFVKVVGGNFVDGKTYEFQYPLSTIVAKVLDDYVEFIHYAQVPEDVLLYHQGNCMSLTRILKDEMTKKEMKSGYIEFKCVSAKTQLSETVLIKVYRERVFWQEGKPEYIPIELTVPRQTTTVNDVKMMVQELKGTPVEQFHLYFGIKMCDNYRRVQEYVGTDTSGNFHAKVKALGGARAIKQDSKIVKGRRAGEIKALLEKKTGAVASSDDVIHTALSNHLKEFVRASENNPLNAMKGQVGLLELPEVEGILNTLTKKKDGGNSDAKLRSISSLFFGKNAKKISDKKDAYEETLDGMALLLQFCFNKIGENQKFQMPDLVALFEAEKNKKIGAMSAAGYAPMAEG